MSTSLPNLNEIPNDCYLALEQLSAIRLSGEEQVKYLQGQVTCDVEELTDNSLLHGAHCDAKGKVLSAFRLIKHGEDLLLIQPSTSIELSLAELKKFGVFAKVDISQAEDIGFACIIGDAGAQYIKSHCNALPDEQRPVINHESLSICYIAGTKPRYLIVGEKSQVNSFTQGAKLALAPSCIWQLLEITNGFPLLSTSSVQKYVPQMLNLDKIAGISFTKGCYLGQETVARMQYLGKNKKMMGLLIGNTSTPTTEQPDIEKQLGDNWRSAGDVLSYYLADDGTCYIQAVIANDLSDENPLRIKADPSSSLTLSTISYLQD